MFLYYPLYLFVWLIAWLPLEALYIISDLVLYPAMYHLVGYRKKVTRTNIENSFPEKNKKELRSIERKFYHFLSDSLIESIYEMHISEKEFRRRMSYENTELILEQYAQNKSVMIMTAHYCNWEWIINFPLFMPKGETSSPIYKKQTNPRIDRLLHELRSKFGAQLIERRELLRTMFRLKNDDKKSNFWMVSDQRPAVSGQHYWTQFLNQETAAITGTEELAKKFDYPVFYAEINRIKRGYYNCKFIPITTNPNQNSNFEITEKYMRLLEKTIQANPAYWLWSHNRWKHKRAQ